MVTGTRSSGVRRAFVDVSTTLSAPFLSGFQRHTRALVNRLPTVEPDDEGLLVTPVVWCEGCRAYRRLDAAESERLRHAPRPSPPPRATFDRLADLLPGPLGGMVVRLGRTRVVHWLREALARRRRGHAHDPASHPALVEMGGGDAFVDIDAGWQSPAPREVLLGELRAAGVRTGWLVADVMPELHPEWFSEVNVEHFGRYARAHLRHSDHVVSISRQTTRDLARLAGALGRTRPMQVVHVTMGSDFDETPAPARTADAATRTLLCVGTLEPRKNQALLIDVLDRLRTTHPEVQLLLVGRATELCADLVERIRTHPAFGRSLRWEPYLDDAGLAAAYADAFLALAPSRYEGYGIPVAEALARGVPTIAGTGGALREAGGDAAEYADVDDVDAWVAAIERHLVDASHHEAARRRAESYRPPTWAQAAELLAAALVEMTEARP